MGYPLWGQDLDVETTPLEAGLGWAVDWEGDFIGRAALEGADPSRRRVGLLLEERTIARAGAQISLGGRPVGRVTSGTYSHTLSAGIGQGYVEASANVEAGEELGVEVRGAEARARAAKLPLLPRRTRESWAQSRQGQEQ
jgi:aminomethyltransferase